MLNKTRYLSVQEQLSWIAIWMFDTNALFVFVCFALEGNWTGFYFSWNLFLLFGILSHLNTVVLICWETEPLWLRGLIERILGVLNSLVDPQWVRIRMPANQIIHLFHVGSVLQITLRFELTCSRSAYTLIRIKDR
jgi:hypothetical protein